MYCNKSYVTVAPCGMGPLAEVFLRLRAFWGTTSSLVRTHFLLMSSTHKSNAFFILTKNLPRTMGITFAVLRTNSKTSTNFFSLHSFMDRRFILIID